MRPFSALFIVGVLWCSSLSAGEQPDFVGLYANFDRFDFTGNETFPVEQLRSALKQDIGLLPYSRSDQYLDELLHRIEKALIAGYQQRGFAKVNVQATWNEFGLFRIEKATGRILEYKASDNDSKQVTIPTFHFKTEHGAFQRLQAEAIKNVSNGSQELKTFDNFFQFAIAATTHGRPVSGPQQQTILAYTQVINGTFSGLKQAWSKDDSDSPRFKIPTAKKLKGDSFGIASYAYAGANCLLAEETQLWVFSRELVALIVPARCFSALQNERDHAGPEQRTDLQLAVCGNVRSSLFHSG